MRLEHLIGATSNATAARCRESLASSLSKIAPMLSNTASVQVGPDLFGQIKTLNGVALRATGAAERLAVPDRRESDLRADAGVWAARHDAAHLYLSRGYRLDHVEPARHRALLSALNFVVLGVNVVLALLRPRNTPDNAWDGPSLEWATSSPPPWNFTHIP